MAAPRIVFSQSKLQQARWQFEETATPKRDIAAFLGCSVGTLNQRAGEEGWVRGRARAPREERIGSQAPPAKATGGAPPMADALAAALEQKVERELSTIAKILEKLGAPGRSAEAERTARTLASLSRTLSELKRARAAAPPAPESDHDDDDMPRDIDEFRRAVARRIDAFVAGRTDAALSRDGEDPDS